MNAADVVTPRTPRRVLIVGVGVSARAAARLAAEHGIETIVVDRDDTHPGFRRMEAIGHDVVVDPDPDPAALGVDVVVPSPAISEQAPVLERARRDGIEVWSEPQFGLLLRPRRLLAVTGTNGKTSTTELLAAMLEEDGQLAIACGNIGLAVSDVLVDRDPSSVLVAELSSFQLRFAGRVRCEVGVLLNLAGDHLDWHRDLEAYAEAKARMWEAQRDGDVALANEDEPATIALRDRHARCDVASFSATRPVGHGVGVEAGRLAYFAGGERGDLVAIDELTTDASHHVSNVAAAASVASLVGCAPAAIRAVATSYEPGEHRGRLIATLDGVRWVDDSKATNPHAAAAALSSATSIVWIAGGLAKGVELEALRPHLSTVQHAVLIGTSAPTLAEVCERGRVPWTMADGMDDAVERAARIARRGDTVLLAPACASFDQFRDYRARGEAFARAVRSLDSREQAGGVRP